MSDDKKPAEAKDKKDEAAKAGGGKGKYFAFAIVGLILVGASSAAGAVVAPMIAKHQEPPKKAAQDEPAEDEEETKVSPTLESLPLESIVIDVRNDQGEVHHIKLGVVVEIKMKVGEEELKSFVPRARDAAITYMRSLTPADVTSSQRFEVIRKELGERITKAIGKKFVKGILITDFVVQ